MPRSPRLVAVVSALLAVTLGTARPVLCLEADGAAHVEASIDGDDCCLGDAIAHPPVLAVTEAPCDCADTDVVIACKDRDGCIGTLPDRVRVQRMRSPASRARHARGTVRPRGADRHGIVLQV